MDPEHKAAGKRFRRKVAKELRAAFRQCRREDEWYFGRGYGRFVIGNAAKLADMTPDELRSFLFGTHDLDAHRCAVLAHAFGCTASLTLFKPVEEK